MRYINIYYYYYKILRSVKNHHRMNVRQVETVDKLNTELTNMHLTTSIGGGGGNHH